MHKCNIQWWQGKHITVGCCIYAFIKQQYLLKQEDWSLIEYSNSGQEVFPEYSFHMLYVFSCWFPLMFIGSVWLIRQHIRWIVLVWFGFDSVGDQFFIPHCTQVLWRLLGYPIMCNAYFNRSIHFREATYLRLQPTITDSVLLCLIFKHYTVQLTTAVKHPDKILRPLYTKDLLKSSCNTMWCRRQH